MNQFESEKEHEPNGDALEHINRFDINESINVDNVDEY